MLFWTNMHLRTPRHHSMHYSTLTSDKVYWSPISRYLLLVYSKSESFTAHFRGADTSKVTPHNFPLSAPTNLPLLHTSPQQPTNTHQLSDKAIVKCGGVSVVEDQSAVTMKWWWPMAGPRVKSYLSFAGNRVKHHSFCFSEGFAILMILCIAIR